MQHVFGKVECGIEIIDVRLDLWEGILRVYGLQTVESILTGFLPGVLIVGCEYADICRWLFFHLLLDRQ